MPLVPDRPISQRCGACAECAKACPALAIRNVAAQDGYGSREQALHFDRCAEQTLRFKSLPGTGARICGICVRACPFAGDGDSSKDRDREEPGGSLLVL